MNLGPIIQQLQRIRVTFADHPAVVLIELLVIGVLVYLVLRFLRGTRGARVIKGLMFLLILATLSISVFGGEETFARLRYLYSNLLEVVALGLIIVFQPEIRRALVRLGEARFFRGGGLRRARVVEELLEALTYMSANKIGALIAIERHVGLGGIIEAGTRLDAAVSRSLLNTIFWPGSALHDMGVVIRGDRIVAAGVQFPLAEGGQLSPELGSRHRAALGLAQESDALVLIVSEETGIISLAERNLLTRELSIDDMRQKLTAGLGQAPMPVESDNERDPAPSEGT